MPPSRVFRDLLDIDRDAAITPGQIGAVKMGTTVATNALLERRASGRSFSSPRDFAMRYASVTRRVPIYLRATSSNPKCFMSA